MVTAQSLYTSRWMSQVRVPGRNTKKYVVIVSAGSIQPREENEKFILIVSNDLWGHYNKKKKYNFITWAW